MANIFLQMFFFAQALKVVTENGDVERGYSPLGFYE